MSGRFPEFVASRFPEGTKRRLQSLARAFDHKGLTISQTGTKGSQRRNKRLKATSADVHRYALDLGLTIYERRAAALELETGERLLDTDLTDCKTDEESS